MTDREHELLGSLRPTHGPPEWWRPLDLGGSDASHHSKTLRRMVEKGWAEREQQRAHVERGSYRYRITPKGLQAWANANATRTK